MDIIQEAKKYAISEKEKFGTPSLTHFEIIEKKVIELAGKLNADKKVAQIGVYLMDLKLGQALKEDRLSEHVAMSVEAAKEFLNKFDISDLEKDKIINCIEAHHRGVPFKSIEAEICANADCYKFIHPKGFFSYLTVLGKRYPNFEDSLNQAEKKLDEKYQILSLNICKNELKDFYNTFKKLIKAARSL